MADNARDQDEPATDEAALSARLRRLGEKLDGRVAGKQVDPGSAPQSFAGPSGFARGFQLSSELVGGVVVGAVIGWSLDYWLGISPWGMIVFVLVGFAAGVMNVMRSAGVWPSRRAGNRLG